MGFSSIWTDLLLGLVIPIGLFLLVDKYFLRKIRLRHVYLILMGFNILLYVLSNLSYMPGSFNFMSLAYYSGLIGPITMFYLGITGFLAMTAWWFRHLWFNEEIKNPLKHRFTAIFLTTVLLFFLLQPQYIKSYSIDYVCKRADILIETIEDVNKQTGSYPDSFDTQKIITPGIIGSESFGYKKHLDGYILLYTISGTPFNADIFIFDPYDLFDADSTFLTGRKMYLYGYKALGKGWEYYYYD